MNWRLRSLLSLLLLGLLLLLLLLLRLHRRRRCRDHHHRRRRQSRPLGRPLQRHVARLLNTAIEVLALPRAPPPVDLDGGKAGEVHLAGRLAHNSGEALVVLQHLVELAGVGVQTLEKLAVVRDDDNLKVAVGANQADHRPGEGLNVRLVQIGGRLVEGEHGEALPRKDDRQREADDEAGQYLLAGRTPPSHVHHLALLHHHHAVGEAAAAERSGHRGQQRA